MKCKKCQFENPEGIGFCINCGTDLGESKESNPSNIEQNNEKAEDNQNSSDFTNSAQNNENAGDNQNSGDFTNSAQVNENASVSAESTGSNEKAEDNQNSSDFTNSAQVNENASVSAESAGSNENAGNSQNIGDFTNSAQNNQNTSTSIQGAQKSNKNLIIIGIAILLCIAAFFFLRGGNKMQSLYEKGDYGEIIEIFNKKDGKVSQSDALVVANAFVKENEKAKALEIYKTMYRTSDFLNKIEDKSQLQGLYNYVALIIESQEDTLLDEFVNMSIDSGSNLSEVKSQQEKANQALAKIKYQKEAGRIAKEIASMNIKFDNGENQSNKTGGYFVQNNMIYASPMALERDFPFTIGLSQGIVTVTDNLMRKTQFKLKGGNVEVMVLGGKYYYNLDDLLKAMRAQYNINLSGNEPAIKYLMDKIKVVINGSQRFTIERPVISNGVILYPVRKIMDILNPDGNTVPYENNGVVNMAYVYDRYESDLLILFSYYYSRAGNCSCLYKPNDTTYGTMSEVVGDVAPQLRDGDIYMSVDMMQYLFGDYFDIGFNKDENTLYAVQGGHRRDTIAKKVPLTIGKYVKYEKYFFDSSPDMVLFEGYKGVGVGSLTGSRNDFIRAFEAYYPGYDVRTEYDSIAEIYDGLF